MEETPLSPERLDVMATPYNGSCHCGGVRFTVVHEPDEMTTCDCSLCAKRTTLMVKVPEAALRVIEGEDLLALYEWNTHRAKHHFCSRCGSYVFHRKRAAPDHFGVNVFCLDDFDHSALPIRATEGANMTLECEAPNPTWPGAQP